MGVCRRMSMQQTLNVVSLTLRAHNIADELGIETGGQCICGPIAHAQLQPQHIEHQLAFPRAVRYHERRQEAHSVRRKPGWHLETKNRERKLRSRANFTNMVTLRHASRRC